MASLHWRRGDLRPRRAVGGDPPGAVKDGGGAVRIRLDADLDVVGARMACGQLPPAAAIGDGVVAGHHPLLLDAQGLGEKGRIGSHECGQRDETRMWAGR